MVANMLRHMLPGNREVPMNVDNYNETTDNEGNDAHQPHSAPDANYLSINDTDRPPGPTIIVDVIEPSDHSEA